MKYIECDKCKKHYYEPVIELKGHGTRIMKSFGGILLPDTCRTFDYDYCSQECFLSAVNQIKE